MAECCWFSTLLREVFLRVLRFSPLLKNLRFQIPIRSWNARTFLNEFFELLGASWINKWHLHLNYMRQSNLFLDFFKIVEFLVRSLGTSKCFRRKCFPMEEDALLWFSPRWCKSRFVKCQVIRSIGTTHGWDASLEQDTPSLPPSSKICQVVATGSITLEHW